MFLGGMSVSYSIECNKFFIFFSWYFDVKIGEINLGRWVYVYNLFFYDIIM